MCQAGKMNKAEYLKAMSEYVKSAQPILRLADWDIELQIASDEEDHASLDFYTFGPRVVLTLGQKFWGVALEEKRDTILHELLHIKFVPYSDRVAEIINKLNSKRAQNKAKAETDDMEDHVIEDLTRAMRSLMPAFPANLDLKVMP